MQYLTCVTHSTDSMYSSSNASHVPSFTLCAIALENVYLSKSEAILSSLIKCKLPFWIELFLKKITDEHKAKHVSTWYNNITCH